VKSFTCFKSTVTELKVKAEEVLASSPPMIFNCIKTDGINLLKTEYNPAHRMFLIWEPLSSPGTSVFSPNVEDGWHTLVHILSTKYFCDSASVRLSSPKSICPICELSTYANGHAERLVRVMKDEPKWEFYETGKPYDFEDVGIYKKRIKRQRFTQEMLSKYMKNLGWDIDAQDFFRTKTFGFLFKER